MQVLVITIGLPEIGRRGVILADGRAIMHTALFPNSARLEALKAAVDLAQSKGWVVINPPKE